MARGLRLVSTDPTADLDVLFRSAIFDRLIADAICMPRTSPWSRSPKLRQKVSRRSVLRHCVMLAPYASFKAWAATG